ncbi:MAG TPA: protein kinase [Vicinamibacterales bacterium]|nr:protein kinase [Vicinamibacterales bacterium]
MALVAGTSVGRYEIQSPLGAGGMGEVYLARDPLLGRTVAVKLLPSAFAADPDRLRRFEQEAQTTAALNHPRILAVHDIGRIGDQPFIVMEYVRGETLAAHVRKGRPSLARALEIGIEIANALGAAHRARVVHRDLKPANVMVTGDGHVKVLDFGLAKFLQHETSLPTGEDGEPRVHTTTGQIMGTPPYMSPEQLLGDRVDERTDIYTLGVMLFELVTGHRPHDGDIGELIRNAALTTPIRTVRDVDPAIAPEISETIARCMARNPANRFQTAGALETELRRVLTEVSSDRGRPPLRSQTLGTAVRKRRLHGYAAWLIAGALAIGGLAAAPLLSRLNVTDTTERPVIAVLTFANLTGDESKSHLGLGVARLLENSLGRLPSITVVSQSESVVEAGATLGLEAVARELGATMLVQGSIQQSGDRLLVIARLVTPDERQVWSDKAEDREAELFSIQNRLAESLLATLRVKVSVPERMQLARSPSDDPVAMDAYLRGLELLDRPDLDFDAAVRLFKQATARDSKFAEAFAALGETYRRHSVRTNNPKLMDDAVTAIDQALRLDAVQPDVRLSLASVLRSTGRQPLAVLEVKNVLADQPDNPRAHRLLGELLAKAGQPREALEAFQKALEVQPNYWLNHEVLGLFFLGNRQYADAIREFTLLAKLKPDDEMPLQQLGATYLARDEDGDRVRASQSFKKSNEVRANAVSFANLGYIAYSEQRYDEAIRDYERAANLEPKIALNWGNLGDAYRKGGRKRDATVAYNKAIDAGENALKVNQNDAAMESLLGLYYAKVGSKIEAELYTRRAFTTNPSDLDVLYRRAAALALIGQRDDAVKRLAEAIERGYPFHQARDDDDLASLRSLRAFQELDAAAKKR